MRTRTLLVLTALLAWMLGTGVWIEHLIRLSIHYRERAAYHSDQERFASRAAISLEEWVAYLKQTASKATDINRDSINDYAKENGITGVAMISIDGDWSGLRMKRIEP